MIQSNTPEDLAGRPGTPTAVGCPYLLAADGGWRASTPTRDHRCTAVAPSAVLAADKQRRLCLTDVHRTCATYMAATGGAAISGSEAAGARGRRRDGARPIARTTPMVLDHGRVSLVIPGLAGERPIGQVLLIGLMGLAFAAILLARLTAGSGADGPTDPASLAGAAGPTASPTASPTRVSEPTPEATQEPSEDEGSVASETPTRTLVPTEVEPSSASASPKATPGSGGSAATYTVKRGDTLSGIAARYATTWQAIAKLNGIKDPSRLKIGQVLELP